MNFLYGMLFFIGIILIEIAFLSVLLVIFLLVCPKKTKLKVFKRVVKVIKVSHINILMFVSFLVFISLSIFATDTFLSHINMKNSEQYILVYITMSLVMIGVSNIPSRSFDVLIKIKNLLYKYIEKYNRD